MSTTMEPTAGAAAPARMTRQEVLQALSGLMMGIFVSILAATVVSTALPRIIADLDGSQSSYTWVVTAELLAMTATVPLWGKLADLYNQKLLVQLSLVFFVVGSVVAGLSTNMEMLIGSRVLQGIGAGGLTALVQIVMASMIPPRELGKYAGIFGAVFATGTVAGPLIGGLMVDTDWLGWRWCFFLGVPFSLVSIVLLQKTLKLPTFRRDETHVDYLGAFLITAGVSALLIWTTLAGDTFEWASSWTAILVTGGVVLLGVAVWVEGRVREPIIPLDLFRNRTVTLTTMAGMLVGVALFGGTVFLAQFFQISKGMSPTAAGFMSLPMVGGLLVSSTVAGQLITKHGAWKRYLVAGSVIMTVALGLLSTISQDTSKIVIGVFMALLGVGVGMLMQNLVLAAQNDVPARELGSATSVASFFRSMGGAVGVSVLGAVLANRVASVMSERLGASAPAGGTSEQVPDLTTLPPEMLAIVQEAYASATANVFLVATPIAAVAVILVLFLKEKPLKTQTGIERLHAEAAEAAGVTGPAGAAAAAGPVAAVAVDRSTDGRKSGD